MYIGCILLIRLFLGNAVLNSISIPNIFLSMSLHFINIGSQLFLIFLIVKEIFFEEKTKPQNIDSVQNKIPTPVDVQVPLITQIEVPQFNYKRKSSILISAAIFGIVLTFIYYMVKIGCNNWDHPCSDTQKLLQTAILNVQTLYYGGVAIIFLIAGLFLRFKKKIGLHIFCLGVILIVASFFIPSNFFLQEFSPSIGFTSLFLNSIKSAFLGSIIMMGLPIVGVVVYFGVIIINLSILNNWANFLDIKLPKIKIFKITYVQLFIFIIILLWIGYTLLKNHQQRQSKNYWSHQNNNSETVNIDF